MKPTIPYWLTQALLWLGLIAGALISAGVVQIDGESSLDQTVAVVVAVLSALGIGVVGKPKESS